MFTAIIVTSVMLCILILERLYPRVALPHVASWWPRALLFNGVQASSALLGVYLWDAWFAQAHLFSLAGAHLLVQVLVGYLLITFIYYWWHRARHQINVLWRFLHQLHHSPARIEVFTSFYKHPSEIVINGVLSSAILYLVLGLSAPAVSLTVLATALAELIYHMNLPTPYVMGWFFQRPEMHRVHHQRGLHHYNYSDLPLWDMLFGTYLNPKVEVKLTGFPERGETQLKALLSGVELPS